MQAKAYVVVSVVAAVLFCGCEGKKGGTPTGVGTPVAAVQPSPVAPSDQSAFPPIKPSTSAEVKKQLRVRWEADFSTVQERINDRLREGQEKVECQQRLDRLKTLIAEFAQRDLQPDDLTVVVALGRDVESLKREVGFFVSNADYSNMGGLSAMSRQYDLRGERDPRLPNFNRQGGWCQLDNELHQYAVCLVNYPELKDVVIRDLAQSIFDHYEYKLVESDNRQVPFFSRHVPGQSLDLGHMAVAESPADALKRANVLDPKASGFHLRRLVWAEWLLENRGLKPYREVVWGEGKDKTGKPYSYNNPDRSRPTLAGLLSQAFWGNVRDTAK